MAVLVVQGLEVVEVDIEDRARAAVAAAMAEAPRRLVHEGATIEQPGQRVGARQRLQLLPGARLLERDAHVAGQALQQIPVIIAPRFPCRPPDGDATVDRLGIVGWCQKQFRDLHGALVGTVRLGSQVCEAGQRVGRRLAALRKGTCQCHGAVIAVAQYPAGGKP